MRPLQILETCLYADDLESAERFYVDVLKLRFVSRQKGRHVFFRCGDSMLLLFNPRATRDPSGDVPPHGATGPGHVAFAVAAEDLKAWGQRLLDHDVPWERVIDWPNGAQSIYFSDPAGNSLEFATPSLWRE